MKKIITLKKRTGFKEGFQRQVEINVDPKAFENYYYKRGILWVTPELFREDDFWSIILALGNIVEIEYKFTGNQYKITLISPYLEIVEEGKGTPEYELIIEEVKEENNGR